MGRITLTSVSFLFKVLTCNLFRSVSVPVGGGGWSLNGEDHQPWLQLDLRDRLKVTAIATQGRWGSSDWVSRYQLQYSDSGRTWRPYRQEDVIWVSLETAVSKSLEPLSQLSRNYYSRMSEKNMRRNSFPQQKLQKRCVFKVEVKYKTKNIM